MHGLAEHSGRYRNVADYFVERGYAVYGFDYRGHGKSEGSRSYTDRFTDLTGDLHTFAGMVKGFHPDKKLFLVGHSIGATIATAYAVKYPEEAAGLILSALELKAGESITPLVKLMARVLSVIFPRMGVSVLDASTISRDRSVVEAYAKDPLIYRGKIPARMGAELLTLMDKSLPLRLGELKLPLLIMHGTEDRLASKEGSIFLYNEAGSPDKTLKLYEGFYHEIFNEPEQKTVFADMGKWLAAH